MNVDNIKKEEYISENDDLLIVLDSRKQWITKARKGKQFHCHKGFFDFDAIIGKSFGISVLTNKSVRLTIYKPLPSDFLMNIPHSSQIIYPKDAGLILLFGGVKPGAKVIEAGTGSAALTSILAQYVLPEGHVYTYEQREEAYKNSKKNIERLNLEEFVTLHFKDANEGFEEQNVDSVILDLGAPCSLIPQAYDSLKPSGVLSVFLPTYNQIEKVFTCIKQEKFGDIKALELIRRDLQLKPNAIRPRTRMIGHTGFLFFARKLLEGDN
ncbi:MAG: tRNA (adenine-N1)-methyltransferase [Candidatus Heimdallarchaeaceae archaeon]